LIENRLSPLGALEESPLTAGAAMEIHVFPAAHLLFVALLTRTKPPPTQRGK
jgi:hypothetical protein